MIISPRAQSDLREIRAYVAQHNQEAAGRIIRSIRDRIKLLARHPGLGQRREEISPDLRNFPVGRYVIFYRIDGQTLIILRVLHGSQDAGNQL
ncbi:MAG: type II toxin-antitoxin system RelE/ParE family toxin [Planctomycetaceae bacterium]|nr:type II toxin-antitoxin system RelE/ParE family toxin [Planctomycetaceae bacterium]